MCCITLHGILIVPWKQYFANICTVYIYKRKLLVYVEIPIHQIKNAITVREILLQKYTHRAKILSKMLGIIISILCFKDI